MTPTLFPNIAPTAVFSPDRRFRYELTRTWTPALPLMGVIGLNPSTADESNDDPTIRREIGFAKGWGYGGLIKANLYAWRSTDPAVLKKVADPVGPDNDAAILSLFDRCAVVLAAWGVNALPGRADAVCKMIADRGHRLQCFGVTKDGHPKHPLYLPGNTMPVEFEIGGSR